MYSQTDNIPPPKNDPIGAKMAKLQKPQVLLHNSGQDGKFQKQKDIKYILK